LEDPLQEWQDSLQGREVSGTEAAISGDLAMEIEETGYVIDEAVPQELQVALASGLVYTQPLANAMGITPKAIFVQRDEETNAIAKYVNGSCENAIIVFYAWQFEGIRKAELDMAIGSTLVHELIHAYLETLGVYCCEYEHDEDAVEDLTRQWCDCELKTPQLLAILQEDADNALNS
jgi:hypothetical protein